jgi:FkbM family methyltransferase
MGSDRTEDDERVRAMSFRKLIRTAHVYAPIGRDRKEAAQLALLRLLGRPHEEDFAALMCFREFGVLVDVGGNYGQSIWSMRLFCPNALIVSFEPNVLLADKIRRRYCADAHVQVKALGLSSKAGEFDLHVPSYRGMTYPGLASVDESEARGWLSGRTIYGFRDRYLAIGILRCRFDTLDAQQLAPSFIKVDVQGHEYEVLLGGLVTISQHRPVLMLESAWRDQRINDLLKTLGYDEYAFHNGTFTRCSARRLEQPLNTFFISAERAAGMGNIAQ